ncbi:MAG: ABC transporter permease [Clostridiales bacterium]
MISASLIKSEFGKLKRSSIWIVSIIIPIIINIFLFIDLFLRYDNLIVAARKKGLNSWELLIKENSGPLMWLNFISVFIAVIAIMVYQVEYDQGSMKSMLSLPISKMKIFFTKFIIIFSFSCIIVTINTIGLVLVGFIMNFPEKLEILIFIKYFAFQCLGIMGIVAIHNWISSLFKNPIVPITIAVSGFIVSLGLPHELPEVAKFFPYSHPIHSVEFRFDTNVALIGGIATTIIFFTIGIIEFSQRDIL